MDYPVTTPFGQVSGYPLNNGFHNGIDYGYPMGTPVVVNGVTIGLSNNTGASIGPHLHVGKFVGGAVQNPGVGNGFQFNSAVVFDIGEDAVDGKYVRVTGDGALWNYLHLEKVLVTKGQVLKGEIMAGVTIIGAPSSVGSATKRIDVVARGSDDNLYQKYFDSAGWHDWVKIGSGVASSPSISAPYQDGRLDVFFTGGAGDLVHTYFDGKQWTANESLDKIKE